MEYTQKQKEFLTALEMGRNIYLSGPAGTGKSTIVKAGQQLLKELNRKFVAVAPTGRAANNIDGETIHSFFRVNPHKCMMDIDDCNMVNAGKKIVYKKAQTIFIDECSMVRVDLFDAIHMTMKKNGVKDGLKSKQVVMIGDFKQLPPIASDNEKQVLSEKYDGITFLDSDIMKELDFLHIDLDEIVRQNDKEFIEALMIVRNGGKAPYFRQFVTNDPSGVILAPYNSTVRRYNDEGLEKQEGALYKFEAIVNGNLKAQDYSLEQEILVKEGCKIMYLVNSRDNPLRNGTLGTFVCRLESDGVCRNSYMPEDELKLYIKVGNTEWPIEPYTAHKYEYVYDKVEDKMKLEERGSITQYPFKLAYAMSIHKSQGMTFDDMTVDLRGGCFQKEQYYVALSRATGPKALRIII
jgi:ATP-dependent DNA helicase PIF1